MAAMFSSTRQEFSGIGVLCYLYVQINILVQCMYLHPSNKQKTKLFEAKMNLLKNNEKKKNIHVHTHCI